jgi:hypothetical protein
MKTPYRGSKYSAVIAFSILVTSISLITCIGAILYLEPIVQYRYQRGLTMGPLETVIINLRPCIWVGLVVSPIVGWRYAQAKLSGRRTVGILSLIAIVEMGYLLLDLVACALSGPPAFIGG